MAGPHVFTFEFAIGAGTRPSGELDFGRPAKTGEIVGYVGEWMRVDVVIELTDCWQSGFALALNFCGPDGKQYARRILAPPAGDPETGALSILEQGEIIPPVPGLHSIDLALDRQTVGLLTFEVYRTRLH